jgi:integrase
MIKGYIVRRTRKDPKTGKHRKASVWSVVYDEPVAQGEPRNQRTRSGFPTRKAAEAWFEAKREELRAGIFTADETSTLGAYLREWVERVDVQNQTRRAYRIYVEKYIIPTLGSLLLRDLRAGHIEAARDRWLTEPRVRVAKDRKDPAPPLSGHSVKHALDTLRVALRRAREKQLIVRDPFAHVKAPRFEKPEMTALDAAQAGKLLELADDSIIGAAIATAIGTGLALRWSDLDLDAARLTVHRAIERVDGVTRFKEPKTRRSRRTVALPPFVVERLRRQRVEQVQRFSDLAIAWPTGETIVFDRAGEPWIPNSFGLLFDRLLRRTGLPRVRLHDLRHSYASLMLEAGVDLTVVSRALGHSNISTTADLYSHINASMFEGAADRLDRAIGNATRRP